MRIHELEISRFRGIQHLKWTNIPDGVLALIGPGDSGKTTVLEALAVLFHAYWTLNLGENDFYGHGTEEPIEIVGTIVDPPRPLIEDRQFLPYLRGVDGATGYIVDEPEDHLPALTIRFRMGSDFEPTWEVICDRHDQGTRISGEKRRQFGVRQINATGADLRWGTRSPLRTVTNAADEDLTESVLRDAAKAARAQASEGLKALGSTVNQVAEVARLLRAARVGSNYSAELDADLASLSRGSVSLHADDLPVERAGLGTRRLVSVAVESLAQSGATVLLCDELEIGLEPHRVRHLVRYLQSRGKQVFLTTHSPTVLRELGVDQLRLLRPGQIPGSLNALALRADEYQGPVRKFADAFLASRIAVCEGLTEVGFVLQVCADLEASDPARLSVVEPIHAVGDNNVVGYATMFDELGFEAAVVCDNDTKILDLTPLPPSVTTLRCDVDCSIEQQVLNNATGDGCVEAVGVGVGAHGKDVVRAQLRTAGITDDTILDALLTGDSAQLAEAPSRQVAIASKSKRNPWFKSVAGGETLARIAAEPRLVT